MTNMQNTSNPNLNPVEPKKTRFQTDQLRNNDFDLFAAQESSKKSSPYMKK